MRRKGKRGTIRERNWNAAPIPLSIVDNYRDLGLQSENEADLLWPGLFHSESCTAPAWPFKPLSTGASDVKATAPVHRGTLYPFSDSATVSGREHTEHTYTRYVMLFLTTITAYRRTVQISSCSRSSQSVTRLQLREESEKLSCASPSQSQAVT